MEAIRRGFELWSQEIPMDPSDDTTESREAREAAIKEAQATRKLATSRFNERAIERVRVRPAMPSVG